MFRLRGSTFSGEGTAHHTLEGKMRNIILREKEFRSEVDDLNSSQTRLQLQTATFPPRKCLVSH